MVMKANRRCSILFHLLVPGGRWVTVIFRSASLAKRCSSRFHSLTCGPLLPPQSAVIGVRVAWLAELLPPTSDAFNGECPGIGIDADADPAKIGSNVVDPVWRDFAQLRYLEVVHPHRFGIALRA